MDGERPVPAVVNAGCTDLQYRWAELRAEAASGSAVRVINRKTGRPRAWLTAGPPDAPPDDARQVAQITVHQLIHSVGTVLDGVARGIVYRINDEARCQVAGYLAAWPPSPLAACDAELPPYVFATRAGRRLVRAVSA